MWTAGQQEKKGELMSDKLKTRIEKLEQVIKDKFGRQVVIINAGDPIPEGAEIVIIDDIPDAKNISIS